MDETQKLKQELEQLKRQVQELVQKMNTHKHKQSDMTQKIELKDLYLSDGSEFFFQMPNVSATPSQSVQTGALTVVGGKLYIYNGSSWVVVGTQT